MVLENKSKKAQLREWIPYLVVLLSFGILMPLAYLLGVLSMNTMTLWGRYFCFAIAAVGVDLVWGFSGKMSLTQALFFCMGAYGLGMYMTLENLPAGQDIPTFLTWSGVNELPLMWKMFANFPSAILFSLLIPAIFALIFGYFIFRSRLKGVYFAIITQALALAMYLLFSRNETLLGGTNGLTGFKYLLGFDLRHDTVKLALYFLALAALVLVFIYARYLVKSKFGKSLIAIRDSESRMRFTGFRVHFYNVMIFGISAGICALGGMLYLPLTGIITPGKMTVQASIEMVVWVALGGRGNIKGAILGAFMVNLLYSLLTSWLPGAWLYLLGGLFVITVLYLDKGLIGLLESFSAKWFKSKKEETVLLEMKEEVEA